MMERMIVKGRIDSFLVSAMLATMSRKTIITADLHYGITSPARILLLRNEILAHDPDVIIIAGDIGDRSGGHARQATRRLPRRFTTRS